MAKFQDIKKMTRDGSYSIHVPWDLMLDHFGRWMNEDKGTAPLDINPEFQRGHVWTEEQQIAYVEFKLRGGVGSDEIRFNCAGWMSSFKGPFVLVDGKQRIEAVRRFLQDEIKIFGHYHSEYTDDMRMFDARFTVKVNDLESMKDVLKWYLEMNTGGTPHTKEEIDKVREMLEQ